MVTSPRKFKRKGFKIWRWCLASIGLVLMSNVVILYRNFNGLEQENMIDSGGTRREWMDSDSLSQTHFDKYSIFESHLRKLMEKSTEDGLDVSKIQNTAPFDVSYAENLIHCDDFVNIKNRTYLASGWTKAVYKGVYKGKNVAIKTVDVKGQDVSTCMAKGHTFEFCYNKAAQKIVKEIIVLQALANDNVIQVLGFCVPGIHSSLQGVAMVTELGDSVDLIRLLQMSWEDRLRDTLDDIRCVWNRHRIRPYRQRNHISGRPFMLYFMPSMCSAMDYGLEQNSNDVQICEEEIDSVPTLPCSDLIEDLCVCIMQENQITLPENPKDMRDLYIFLREDINNSL